MKYRNLILSLACALLALPVMAQQTKSIPITVTASTNNDAVGQRFVYELKNDLNRSGRYTTSSSECNNCFVLVIASTSPLPSCSAISVTLVMRVDSMPIMINGWLSTVRLDGITDGVKEMTAVIDSSIDSSVASSLAAMHR